LELFGAACSGAGLGYPVDGVFGVNGGDMGRIWFGADGGFTTTLL
jgi:hypothetical protein